MKLKNLTFLVKKKKAQYKGGYNMNESNILTKLLGRPQL